VRLVMVTKEGSAQLLGMDSREFEGKVRAILMVFECPGLIPWEVDERGFPVRLSRKHFAP
jgi:hypothetical protein